MAKLIRYKKKKRRRPRIAGIEYRSASPRRAKRRRRTASDVLVAVIRRVSVFVRRHYKIVAASAAGVAIVVVGLVLLLGNETAPADSSTPSEVVAATPSPTVSYQLTEADDVGGLSADYNTEDVEELLLAQEGIRIGVTVGNVTSTTDEFVINRLEEVSSEAMTSGTIYKTFYYNADGDYNQQLQDVRSLIKNEVDVIVAGFCDEESFRMVTTLAQSADIPVVAFDAPIAEGYAINVVADESAWGRVYGQFMASNLASGNLVQILADEDDEADAARAAAITAELASSADIVALDTAYARWRSSKAEELMAGFLEQGAVDGVITEEGMAEGVLDAFIDARVLPKVMCGDATAGFIKKWYTLKNGGIELESSDEEAEDEPSPTPEKFAAQPGEFVVCAQPSTAGIGAAAFDIALEMANGRTLKQEGQTFKYTVETLITDSNLAQYYAQVKDKDDSYMVSDRLSDAALDSLLNPPDPDDAEE